MIDDINYDEAVEKRKKLQLLLVRKLRKHINDNIDGLRDLYYNHFDLIKKHINTIWKDPKDLILFKDSGIVEFKGGISTGVVYLNIPSGRFQLEWADPDEVARAKQIAEVMGKKKPFYIPNFTNIEDYDLADVLDHKDNFKMAMELTSVSKIMKKYKAKRSASAVKEEKRAQAIKALLDNNFDD